MRTRISYRPVLTLLAAVATSALALALAPAAGAAPGAAPDAVAFAPPVLLPLDVSGLESADLDGDGALDLFGSNVTTNRVQVSLGDGAGGFAPAASYRVGKDPYDVAVADLNGDGAPDLVTADAGARSLSVLLGDGRGRFGPATTVPLRYQPNELAVGDFDADGDPDLAVAGSGDRPSSYNGVQVLRGDGAGGFGTARVVFSTFGVQLRGLQPADLDADGRPDLVFTLQSNPSAVLLVNTGSSFAPPRCLPTGVTGSPGRTAVADVDGNGLLDIVTLSVNSGPRQLSVLLSTGAGRFEAPVISPAPGNAQEVDLADLDGDGVLDAVLPVFNRTSNDVAVQLGTGTGAFGTPTLLPAGDTYVAETALGDYDGDADIDIAAGGPSREFLLVNLG